MLCISGIDHNEIHYSLPRRRSLKARSRRRLASGWRSRERRSISLEAGRWTPHWRRAAWSTRHRSARVRSEWAEVAGISGRWSVERWSSRWTCKQKNQKYSFFYYYDYQLIKLTLTEGHRSTGTWRPTHPRRRSLRYDDSRRRPCVDHSWWRTLQGERTWPTHHLYRNRA